MKMLKEIFMKRGIFGLKHQLSAKEQRKSIMSFILMLLAISLFLCLRIDKAFEYEIESAGSRLILVHSSLAGKILLVQLFFVFFIGFFLL